MAALARLLTIYVDGKKKALDSKAAELMLKSVGFTSDSGTTVIHITESGGHFAFEGKNLTSVGTVDGRNVGNDGTTLDGHTTSIGTLQTFNTDLASSNNGDGASKIAIEDANTQFTGTDVEAALDEAMDAAQAAQATADAALPKAGGTMSGAIAMGSQKITGLASGTGANDAVNKGQLDAISSGLVWKETVAAFNLIGNLGEVALEALTPAAGDQYVVTTIDGDGNLGGDVVIAVGDIVEYTGTAWQKIVSHSGGFPPIGTRAVLSKVTALVAPYTEATDDGKIAEFGGASLTASLTTETADAVAVLVQDPAHVSIFDNNGYVFEGTVPTGAWVQFTGAGQINAGSGMTKDGNTLNVIGGDGIVANGDDIAADLEASGGLEINATKLRAATDETTIERNAAGLRLKAGGVGLSHLASDSVDENKIVSSALAATLKGGSGTAVAVDHAVSKTNDNAGSIAVRDIVYVKSNGNVDKAQATITTLDDAAIGIVEDATIATAAPGKITLRRGAIVPGYAGMTPGKMQYVSASTAGGRTETPPSATTQHVFEIGRAISATELLFDPHHVIEIL